MVASDALIDFTETVLSQSGKSSPVPASMVSDALKAVARLKNNGVVLEIPTELAKGIASGELTRVGGVVRDATGAIRGFLKDPTKSAKILSKSATLALVLIDFAQTVLLNEKLAEIQEQLGRIENQVLALRDSKLRSALIEASRLHLISKPADRRVRIHSALTDIASAVPLLNSSLNSHLRLLCDEAAKAGPHGITVFGSKGSARAKCETIVQEIRAEVEFLAALFALRSRLEEELQEYAAAGQSRAELAATVLAWSERVAKIFREGSQINPRSASPNPLHGPLNLLSGDGFDYQQKTEGFCSRMLEDADRQAAGMVRDFALATAIARKPLPTFSD